MPDLVRLMLLTAGLAALLFVATWTARLILDLLHQRRARRTRTALGLDTPPDAGHHAWRASRHEPEDAA